MREADHDEALPDPSKLSFEADPEEDDKRAKTRSDKWRREAGVYVSWRPPCWAADNSKRL